MGIERKQKTPIASTHIRTTLIKPNRISDEQNDPFNKALIILKTINDFENNFFA